MKKTKITSIVLFSLLATKMAFAGTELSNVEVTSKLESNCTLLMNDVNLGVIESMAKADTLINVAAKVLCNNGTAYSLSTIPPELTTNPITGGVLGYTYKMRYLDDSNVDDFVGYRFMLEGSNLTTKKFLGDGNKTSIGTQTYVVNGVGNGGYKDIPLVFGYYTYLAITPGTYGAAHTFTLTF